MNNAGVTGLTAKKDSERANGPRNSAFAVNLTYDRHTTYRQYISPKISIERLSVGHASLAQLEKWFPLQGERGHSSFCRSFKKQNREGGDRIKTTGPPIYPRL